MNDVTFPKVAQLKSPQALRERLAQLGSELPVDDTALSEQEGSPLAAGFQFGRHQVGNRWCIHPMEGWDGEFDGSPSELTLRRWRQFGMSGAKLIWGGEAAAVVAEGRANPRQLLATSDHAAGLKDLREQLVEAHRNEYASADGLVVGLQLTHSGRFCRPNSHDRLEPRIACHHPLLDARFGIAADDDSVVWRDDELPLLIDHYVKAAHAAAQAGFDFVDIKACHGYLLHEFLSARTRPGPFGGDFEGRTRLLFQIIQRILEEVPQLQIGVRLSAFDTIAALSDAEEMDPSQLDLLSFGAYQMSTGTIRWDEPLELIRLLVEKGVTAINVSAGSPYYSPHIQRPAAFPPSDGYPTPEDPLKSAARQLDAARRCKQAAGAATVVATGFTYFQELLPHVAQACVRDKWFDVAGIGRMVLAYPRLPADLLSGKPLARKSICRTFSDCTTGPRHNMVSGCYPLDPFYRSLPEAQQLKTIKLELKRQADSL